MARGGDLAGEADETRFVDACRMHAGHEQDGPAGEAGGV